MEKSTHKVEVVPVKLEQRNCKCGCGRKFSSHDTRGRERHYLHGHNPTAIPRKYDSEICSRCGNGLATLSQKRWIARGLCQSCYAKDRYRRKKGSNPQFEKARRVKIRKKLKETLLEMYGRRCVCCGENEEEFLCLDHVNGGGARHRKVASMDSIYRQAIKETPESGNYRILCFNCNMARGLRKFCPHEIILGPLSHRKNYGKEYA